MNQNSLEELLEGLSPAVRFEPSTDSTNRLALEWARAGAPDWAIIVADYQAAGRGRFDRTWFAPAGTSLLFSVVLRPDCELEEAPLINLAAAVALCEAVEAEGLKARVKWPNDVMVGGLKIAGILAETFLQDNSTSERANRLSIVLGVGINVNVEEFPPELATATSLSMQAGRSIDRPRLLRRFLEALGGLLRSFPAGVVEAYIPRSEVLGRIVQLQSAQKTVTGKAVGIGPSGDLILESGETIAVGDVGYLR